MSSDRSGPNILAALILFVWAVCMAAVVLLTGHVVGFWDAEVVLEWLGEAQ